MEKRMSHYKLVDIQKEVAACGIDCFTRTALHGVIDMGLRRDQALAAIQAMVKAHFPSR